MSGNKEHPTLSGELLSMSIPTGIAASLKALAFALAGISLVACDGGGGDKKNGAANPQDTNPPSVNVISPQFNSATTNRYVQVTGTASDNDSGVASITVNGVEVTTDDAYRNWSVHVPLDSALTQLDILADDRAGNQRRLDHSIRINRISDQLAEPSALGIDAESGQLLITDRKLKKLFRFDLTSPNPSSAPINYDGHDVEFNFPEGFFWSSLNDRMLFMDFASSSTEFEQSLFAINTDTGALAEPVELAAMDDTFRFYDIAGLADGQSVYLLSAPEASSTVSVVREFNLGSGALTEIGRTTAHTNPDYSVPTSLTISENGQRLYFIDNGALMSMEVRNGTLSTISPRTDALRLNTPVDLVVSSQTGKAWIVDSAQAAVIEIDLVNGSRRILSNPSNGAGPAFELPSSMVFDQPRNRLLIADTGLNLVFSVATDSGNREYFISNRHGLGPTLSEPAFVRLSADGRTAYVTDTKLDAIVGIDVTTGVRTLISGSTIGSGETLSEPANLAIDETGASLWVSDLGSGNIVHVDTQTGQRSAITPSYTEGSRILQKPVGIEYDARTRSLLVSDVFNDSAQSLTLSTSSVAMTGSSLMNDGSELFKPVAVTQDNTTNKVYAIDNVRNGLVEWTPSNGGAKLLSTLFVGQGVDFILPVDVQIDETARRAYVSDEVLNAIIEVNLDNGDREVLSGMSQGTGPEFKQISGLDYNPQSRTLVAVDKADRSVYAINLDNGNRQALSR